MSKSNILFTEKIIDQMWFFATTTHGLSGFVTKLNNRTTPAFVEEICQKLSRNTKKKLPIPRNYGISPFISFGNSTIVVNRVCLKSRYNLQFINGSIQPRDKWKFLPALRDLIKIYKPLFLINVRN